MIKRPAYQLNQLTNKTVQTEKNTDEVKLLAENNWNAMHINQNVIQNFSLRNLMLDHNQGFSPQQLHDYHMTNDKIIT